MMTNPPWLNDLIIRDLWSTRAFLLYALAILSPWLSRRTLYWNLVLGAAITVAVMAQRVQPLGLMWALACGALGYAFYQQVHPLRKWGFGLGFVLMGLGLFTHSLPGFQNWKVIEGLQLSALSAPLTLYINYDKPLMAIFILGFGQLVARSWRRVLSGVSWGLLVGVLAGGVVLSLFWILGALDWEPKSPSLTGFWLVRNLLFTCVVEEALFRGFFQTQLALYYPQQQGAVIAISAGLFGLAHLAGGWMYVLAAAIAGVFYAGVYARTKSIEAAITCHFVVNVLHFFLLTYPNK